MGMRRWGLSGVLAAVAVLAAGCGDLREKAAPQVKAFLAAADGDEPMVFEAHIDRVALRADLKGQLMALPEVRLLYDQLGDATGDVAVDRMISPASFQEFRVGLDLPKAAGDKEIARRLKVLGPNRVCLFDPKDKKQCLLTFTRQGKAWKLVGLHATDLRASAPGSF
jgi:hypothetical protein